MRSFMCNVKCPNDFKYVMSGTGPRQIGKCVYNSDNSISVDLNVLPALGPRQMSTSFAKEQARFNAALAEARAKLDGKQMEQVKEQNVKRATEYGRIQGEYAGYSTSAGVLKTMKEVSQSLVPFRPPTAPGDDIESERRAIQLISKQNLLVAQIALFVAMLVLITYIIIPGEMSHMIAFVIIIVGIASGFFLRN